MTTRETAFRIGAGVLAASGTALVGGLVWAGAGAEFYSAYLVGGASWVLAALFLVAAREARRYRTSYLRAAEDGAALPPGGPPR